MKINTISPIGIIPDTRTVQNSGVGLTEVPQVQPGNRELTNTTPNATLVGVGVGMIAAYPGGHRSTKIDANWLNNDSYGKKSG